MEATGGYERPAFLVVVGGRVCTCAHDQPAQRPPLRRGDGSSGEDRPARRQRDRPLRPSPRILQPTPAPSPAQQRLKALVARLRQVTDDLTVQKQRRASLLDNPEMLASIDEVIALLKRQSRTLEGEIASMIDDDPLWATARAEAWRSVKGVAGRTVARLHGRYAGDRHLLQQGHCQARRPRPARRRQW